MLKLLVKEVFGNKLVVSSPLFYLTTVILTLEVSRSFVPISNYLRSHDINKFTFDVDSFTNFLTLDVRLDP